MGMRCESTHPTSLPQTHSLFGSNEVHLSNRRNSGDWINKKKKRRRRWVGLRLNLIQYSSSPAIS